MNYTVISRPAWLSETLPQNNSSKAFLCLAYSCVFLSLVLSEAWISNLFPILQLFSEGLFLAQRDTSGHVIVYMASPAAVPPFTGVEMC